MRRENIPAVAHHLREYIAMNGSDYVAPERIFQVAVVKVNDVIVPNTTICARDHQHALVKAAALVSLLSNKDDQDAGASDIRYCVSEIQPTNSNNGGGFWEEDRLLEEERLLGDLDLYEEANYWNELYRTDPSSF